MTRMLLVGTMMFTLFSCSRRGADDGHVYSTWQKIEIDTCASAWLIKRFVDQKAVFKFYRVGELVTAGIPFDTPDAELRRYHHVSTFESIIARYEIDDWRLETIAMAIHRLEVLSWEERRRGIDELTVRLKESVGKIIDSSKSPLESFERSFPVFDGLYEDLRKIEDHIKDSDDGEEERKTKYLLPSVSIGAEGR